MDIPNDPVDPTAGQGQNAGPALEVTVHVIRHRWTNAELWKGEAVSLRDAVQKAVASDSNLRGSDLSGSDLSGSNLRGSDLSDSDLSGSNLSGSDLSDSNLRGSNLSDSDLSGSNLRGSDLSGSDLSDSNLSDSDLSGSNLRGSDLSDSDLSGSNLRGSDLSDSNLSGSNLRGSDLSGSDLVFVRDDIWAILSAAPAEVPGLLAALKAGKVDGSCYAGECSCLLGTIATTRGCTVDALAPVLFPDSSRPAEAFFTAISPGHTPENNNASKLAVEWIEQWLTAMRAAFGEPNTPVQVGAAV